MTTAKHTPAPWRWQNEPYEDGDPYITIWDGDRSAKNAPGYPHGLRITGIIESVDAALIAAAPDLLEACKMALGIKGITTDERIVFLAAIAKAERTK